MLRCRIRRNWWNERRYHTPSALEPHRCGGQGMPPDWQSPNVEPCPEAAAAKVRPPQALVAHWVPWSERATALRGLSADTCVQQKPVESSREQRIHQVLLE